MTLSVCRPYSSVSRSLPRTSEKKFRVAGLRLSTGTLLRSEKVFRVMPVVGAHVRHVSVLVHVIYGSFCWKCYGTIRKYTGIFPVHSRNLYGTTTEIFPVAIFYTHIFQFPFELRKISFRNRSGTGKSFNLFFETERDRSRISVPSGPVLFPRENSVPCTYMLPKNVETNYVKTKSTSDSIHPHCTFRIFHLVVYLFTAEMGFMTLTRTVL